MASHVYRIADRCEVPINGAGINGRPPGRSPLHPPMAMMVSRADRDYIDAARARSYELAVARGHIRR